MSTPRVTRSASRQSLSSSAARPKASADTVVAANGVAGKSKKKNAAATAAAAAATKTKGTSVSTKKKEPKSKNVKPQEEKQQEVPVTPPRKRQRKNAPSPPKEGPQHHGGTTLDSLAQQHVLEDTPHRPRPPPARPAEPHQTNAMLQTPHGSRVAAYSKESLDASPSKMRLPRPTTDTNRLLEDGIAHLLKVEPRLKPVIDAHHCHIFSPEGLAEPVDPFRALTSGILAQQVSGAAAAAIKKRFVALFIPDDQAITEGDKEDDRGKGAFPAPEDVAKADVSLLRSAGLSQRKAEYVQGLAEKFAGGELSARMLAEASYDEVLEKLIAVRGLGRWSVEMFACFGLKRMDVFSTGDLGVQRGMAAFAGRDVAKLKNKGGKWKYMSEQDMLDMAEKFSPYKTLFMWYMWRVEDVNVDSIQDN